MPQVGSAKVTAVVVTYRAPAALRSCLEALGDQDGAALVHVLIIDNHGDLSDTASIVQASALEARVITPEDNLGPAGGYAVGIAEYLNAPTDYLWLIDDDCYPVRSCLSTLLNCAENATGTNYWRPYQRYDDGTLSDQPGWAGVLLPFAAIVAAGLPRADFFWWKEDVEYLHWRLPRFGWNPQMVPHAIVHHGRVRQSGTRPAWKYYYETRNLVYMRFHVQHRRRWEAFLLPAKKLAVIAAREPDRILKARNVIRGVRDGLSARMGKRVPVE